MGFYQLMMRNKGGGGGGDIPSQYTIVDWIQPTTLTRNNVVCYIDTGIKPNQSNITYFKITFILYSDITTSTSSIGNLFGAEGYSGTKSFNIISYTGNTGSNSGGEANIYNNGISAKLVNNTKMSIELNNKVYSTSLGYSYTFPSFDTGTSFRGTIKVFCVQGRSLSYQAKMKLYEFKLGSSPTSLVCDYVPVYDNVTSKYGVYDKISQTFKTNVGSSSYSFTGGND